MKTTTQLNQIDEKKSFFYPSLVFFNITLTFSNLIFSLFFTMCHCLKINEQLNEIKFALSMYPDQIIIDDEDLKCCVEQDVIDENTAVLVHTHPLTFYFLNKDATTTYEIHFSLDRDYPLDGKIACLVRIYDINETNDNQQVVLHSKKHKAQQKQQKQQKHQHLQANCVKKAESKINRQLSTHISTSEFIDVLGVILWVQEWLAKYSKGEQEDEKERVTGEDEREEGEKEKTDDGNNVDDTDDSDDETKDISNEDGAKYCSQRYNPITDNGTKQNEKLYKQQPSTSQQDGNTQSDCRLWIYSHHIYSKTKRKIINDEASYGRLTGFVRPGKPGFICIEGFEDNCEAFWRKIRSLNWQKISLIIKEYPVNGTIYEKFEDIPMDNSSFIRYLEQHGGSHIIKDYLGLSN